MSLFPPPNEIAAASLEFAAIPQPVRLSVAEPCTLIPVPVLARDKSQVKPGRFTNATAREVIVTFERNRLAKRVFSWRLRTTSTALVLLLPAGGLLAHICPDDGL